MKATPVRRLKAAKIKSRTATKATETLISASTSLPLTDAPPAESDYSDAQFSADLSKSSKQLDLMVSKALEEHAQGKTQEFPV